VCSPHLDLCCSLSGKNRRKEDKEWKFYYCFPPPLVFLPA